MTHAVGGKRPNAWGLYDMHGNVWEWCQDYFDKDYYAKSPADDPPGPAAPSIRVYRGGDWGNPAGYCRSAHRVYSDGGLYSQRHGIRVSVILADK